MSNSASKTNSVDLAIDFRKYSSDRSLARAVQERLSKIRARHTAEMRNVLRQAKQLRRLLIEEARNSQRGRLT